MPRLAIDFEANGLLDKVTKIHCLVAIDIDTNEVSRYHDDVSIDREGTLAQGLAALSAADLIICHNYIGYDRRLIKKLFPEWKEPKWVDTYILSQMLYANEMEQHGIESWGRHFKRFKPAHTDWDNFSEDMLYRCVEDTQILKMLYLKLSKSPVFKEITAAAELEYKVYEIDSEYSYWFMNVPRLEHFTKRLQQLKPLYAQKLVKMVGPRPVEGKPFLKLYKKDGTLSAIVLTYCQEFHIDPSTIVGPFSRVYWEDINPSSPMQMCAWLLSQGWIPDEYNYKRDKSGKDMRDESGKKIISSPKLTGDFLGVRSDFRELIRKYNIITKRLGTLEGFMKRIVGNKIELFAYTCGTNTARYRHKGVVNVPKASKSIYLGRMMRSLFVAPEGYVMVGCDAAQLESRIEGHYTARYDGGEYARVLLEEDVHQKTADQLNLTRSQGKTLNYALQYGCSYKKVALLLDVSDEQAKAIVDLYWENRPAATALKEDLISSVVSRGYARQDNLYGTRAYIRTIDGRPIFVRSWHSLVNSLIQSTGMICMKRALVMADKRIKDLKLRARLAIMYHDEINYICLEKDAETIKQILEESIAKAGEYYNLAIPLKGEAKMGMTWGDIH